MRQLLIITMMLSTLFAKDYIVNQKNKTFIPHELNVKVGDTITFKNSDKFAHNAYTDDELNEFDIGMQKPGKDITIKIQAKSKFIVECAIHPNMLLEVNVTQ